MQLQTILATLSLAIVASATDSCSSPQTLACCDSISNGVGVGCIFSTLNLLNPTCTASQSLACCDAPQVGLINVECVPVSIAV